MSQKAGFSEIDVILVIRIMFYFQLPKINP